MSQTMSSAISGLCLHVVVWRFPATTLKRQCVHLLVCCLLQLRDCLGDATRCPVCVLLKTLLQPMPSKSYIHISTTKVVVSPSHLVELSSCKGCIKHFASTPECLCEYMILQNQYSSGRYKLFMTISEQPVASTAAIY